MIFFFVVVGLIPIALRHVGHTHVQTKYSKIAHTTTVIGNGNRSFAHAVSFYYKYTHILQMSICRNIYTAYSAVFPLFEQFSLSLARTLCACACIWRTNEQTDKFMNTCGKFNVIHHNFSRFSRWENVINEHID